MHETPNASNNAIQELDIDLQNALKKWKITQGSFLVLDNESTTQALHLVKSGFKTSCFTKLEEADENDCGNGVQSFHGNLWSTAFAHTFHFIFDHGFIHSLPPHEHYHYIEKVNEVLRHKGLIFIKCLGYKESDPGSDTYPLSKRKIVELFTPQFSVEILKDSIFNTKNPPFKKAIFAALKKPD